MFGFNKDKLHHFSNPSIHLEHEINQWLIYVLNTYELIINSTFTTNTRLNLNSITD